MQAAPFLRLVKCRHSTPSHAGHAGQRLLKPPLLFTRSVSPAPLPFRALRFYAVTANQLPCAAGLLPAAVLSAKRDIVPSAETVCEKQLGELHDFISNSKRLLVITGAGISTESGIPDYRSPHGAYSKGFKPITHQAFLSSASTRRRYWARSYIGWRRFVSAVPGASHLALARLESRGRVGGGMITQNVDRLHHAAGSHPLELHGTTHRTVCLDCGEEAERSLFQNDLKALNPEWASAVESLERGESGSDASFGLSQRPDGDVEVEDSVWTNADFRVPPCPHCGGMLKPDVVFFGDNVPVQRAASAQRLATECDSLLVVGSSLMVLSAFRLARGAHERGCPVTLLNVGPTRADDLATLKIEARCGEVLSRILAMGSMDVPIVA